MAWLFLEFMMGFLLIPQLGHSLEWILKILAPRRWREATLPPPIDRDNYARAMMLIVLVGIGLMLFLARPLSDVLGREYLPTVLISTSVLAVLAWVLAHLKHWWLLEPGSPLRSTLDSLARGTGTSVGRVRLRQGQALVPRVFPDGSIELSTEFIRRVPPAEQAFLLAAALHHRRTRQPFLSLAGWCLGIVGGPLLIWVLLMMVQMSWTALSVPIGLYFTFCLLYGPQYDLETLKFALSATGDLETIKRVVRRVDAYNAEKRITELREWWEKQPATVPTVSVANTQPVEQQPQTLGRKP